MALEDFIELNWLAVGLALVGSAIFIVMIWKIPVWDDFPFRSKLIISLLLPPVCYFFISKQLDN